MSDDEDGRLLIDDPNDLSGCDLNRQKCPNSSISSSDQVNMKPTNTSTTLADKSNGIEFTIEEGEICDEDSKNPCENGSLNESVDERSSRKREVTTSKGLDGRQNGPESKRMKTNSSLVNTEQRTTGTCVSTRAIQHEFDESPFDLEPGSSFTVQMTVVCKIEQSNTLYITAKWKDQELSGVLTDGESPFGTFNKKSTNRSNGSSSSNISSDSGDKLEKNNVVTPSKKRIARGGQPLEKKKTPAKSQLEDDEDELDVGGTNDLRIMGIPSASMALVETPEIDEMHICPTKGCFFRYSKGTEMDYHISSIHRQRTIIHEDICSQTDVTSFIEYKTVATETDCDLGVTLDQKDNIERLIKSGAPTLVMQEQKLERQSPFSEISDDAPELEKEEPPPKLETPQPTLNLQIAVAANGPVAGTPLGPSVLCPVITSSTSSSFQPVPGPSVSAAPADGSSRLSTPNGPSQSSIRVSASAGLPMNGGFVPTAFTPGIVPGAFATPLSSRANINSPLGSREHKIHQLKAADVPADPATSSASKASASPAQHQQRAFGLPMTPSSTSQAQAQAAQQQQQHMMNMHAHMQAAQIQQMQHAMMVQQMMQQGGRQYPQMQMTPQESSQLMAAAAMAGFPMYGAQK